MTVSRLEMLVFFFYFFFFFCDKEGSQEGIES